MRFELILWLEQVHLQAKLFIMLKLFWFEKLAVQLVFLRKLDTDKCGRRYPYQGTANHRSARGDSG